MDDERPPQPIELILSPTEAQALLDEARITREEYASNGPHHEALYSALALALIEAGVATVEAPIEG